MCSGLNGNVRATDGIAAPAADLVLVPIEVDISRVRAGVMYESYELFKHRLRSKSLIRTIWESRKLNNLSVLWKVTESAYARMAQLVWARFPQCSPGNRQASFPLPSLGLAADDYEMTW